jgi:class 3 adenylate cyclase
MRVDRTLAFLDLCGFTGFTQERGDDAAVAVVAQLRRTLRATAERHGVRVAKWLGDGALVTGSDPARVAVCAADVRDQVADRGPLAIRGGLARGEVILFEEDDYIGAAVNTAARLASIAAPNQILATLGVADAVGDSVSARRLPSRAIRGIDVAIEPFELGAVLVGRELALAG